MRRQRQKRIIRLFDAAVDFETNYEFQKAKKYYTELAKEYPQSPEGAIAGDRIEDMNLLSREKRLYKKIDRDARRIISEIGIDISDSPELMKILMEADAIDFDNEKALYVPLREEYIEECIDMAPTDLEEDPGENAFGVGATPPFLLRPGRDDLLPATKDEFEEICRMADNFKDSIGIFSVPVATDKSISDLECAKMMEKYFSDLKMTFSKNMSDEELKFFHGKEDWLDGTSLITSMTFMPSMVKPFIRSIKNCNNVLLLDRLLPNRIVIKNCDRARRKKIAKLFLFT
jgi:trimethylamine--corrinoid protein Co-methyltransferase